MTRARGKVAVPGNDNGAQAAVGEPLTEFGRDPDELIDLGDLSGARRTGLHPPLLLRLRLRLWVWVWLRTFQRVGDPMSNVNVVRALGS